MESTNVLSRATPRMPGSLQALRRNLPLHRSKKARCKATDGRRDVLLRLLGGAAAAGLSKHLGVLPAPIQSPDLSNCHTVHLPDVPPETHCCLPYSPDTGTTDFKLPPCSSPLRVRPAAHLVDKEYLANYERAVELMKQLLLEAVAHALRVLRRRIFVE